MRKSAPAPAPEAWELNVLGVHDFVAPHPSLQEWFAFLAHSSDLEGDVCEFGVFRGRSLIAAALKLAQLGDTRKVIGFDTFSGFPELTDFDLPERFAEMAERGQISHEHLKHVYRNAELLAATGRTLDPRQSSTSGAFADTSRQLVESIAAVIGLQDRITLFEGEFKQTLALPENTTRLVSAVLIDSDLYESYAEILPWAWERLSVGGMIYLDEYYSLKFPGPRIAVDEFCSAHSLRPTMLRKDGPFERWALFR